MFKIHTDTLSHYAHFSCGGRATEKKTHARVLKIRTRKHAKFVSRLVEETWVEFVVLRIGRTRKTQRLGFGNLASL